MFTGIIEEIGEVVAIDKGQESARLSICGPVVCSDARLGASIAVNGTCLTVTDLDEVTFGCDVMAETLNRTALGWLAPGSRVNLERPVAVAGRLGGLPATTGRSSDSAFPPRWPGTSSRRGRSRSTAHP